MQKESSCKKSQVTKQAKLCNYIRSKDFVRNLASISESENRLSDLQKKEIKYHKTLWKNQEDICNGLTEAHTNISSRVDAIIQQQELQEEKDNIQPEIVQQLNNKSVADSNGNGRSRGGISS